MRPMYWLPVAALMYASLAACGGGGTPQATFGSARDALTRKDHKAYAACFTPQTLGMFNGNLSSVAMMLVVGDDRKLSAGRASELTAIFESHGVPDPMKDHKQIQTSFHWERAFESAHDPTGLYAELLAFIEKHASDKAEMGLPTAEDFVELKDVTINAQSATGTRVWKKKGQLKEDPIEFTKIGRRWMISF